MDSTHCRSCGAPVKWVKTANGKNMPLDPESCEDGNIIIKGETAFVMTAKEKANKKVGPRFKSHFATCPNAAGHRHVQPAEESA
jgi:hypothetical protein